MWTNHIWQPDSTPFAVEIAIFVSQRSPFLLFSVRGNPTNGGKGRGNPRSDGGCSPPRGRKATPRRAIIGQSFNFLYWREREHVYTGCGTGVRTSVRERREYQWRTYNRRMPEGLAHRVSPELSLFRKLLVIHNWLLKESERERERRNQREESL